jgi:hypothetical protein
MAKQPKPTQALLRWSEYVPASDVQDPLGLNLRGLARLYERFRPDIPAGKKGWGAKGDLDLRVIGRLAKEKYRRPVPFIGWPRTSPPTHSPSSAHNCAVQPPHRS